jgi:hypothetical protein
VKIAAEIWVILDRGKGATHDPWTLACEHLFLSRGGAENHMVGMERDTGGGVFDFTAVRVFPNDALAAEKDRALAILSPGSPRSDNDGGAADLEDVAKCVMACWRDESRKLEDALARLAGETRENSTL